MLARLTLTDFRNHATATLMPGDGFVVLTGENGAGKTNVLEAVSLLAPGKGLRRAAPSEMARQDGGGAFGVAAALADGAELGTGTQAAARDRRLVRINGAAAAANSLAEWLTVLWLTPAMDRLFVEPAGERRRFLDRLTLALDPAHARNASRYDAAMRQRNRLLSDDSPPDREWLAAIEAQMVEHGIAVDGARRATVALLDAALGEEAAGPFARASLALEGWRGEPDALARALAEGRARDAAAGRTLAGPHRTDLRVVHRDKRQAAEHCSTGEQKALLLGMVLGHAELVAGRTGRRPVLLLDEVAAHLDPLRRAALFDRLGARGQVWMTGTEAALFEGVGAATRYRVADGRIADD